MPHFLLFLVDKNHLENIMYCGERCVLFCKEPPNKLLKIDDSGERKNTHIFYIIYLSHQNPMILVSYCYLHC